METNAKVSGEDKLSFYQWNWILNPSLKSSTLEPESRENPHWRADKLDKEKSSGKVGGQVEEGVGVVEKVGHAWKDFMNPNK